MKRMMLIALGCVVISGAEAQNPFAKKTWNFPIRNTFVGTRTTDLDGNGNKTDKVTTLSTDFEAMYFPVNNLGIGVTYVSDYTWTQTSQNRNWLASLALKYGFNLSRDFNLYVRGTAGLGKYNYLGRVAGNNNNTKQKGNNSGFTVELGAPIRLNSDATGFLTPFVAYRSEKVDYKNTITDNVDNGVLFGLKFEAYINKSKSLWGFKEGYGLSKTRYAQGRSFLGFSNRGYYESTTTKYNNYPVGEPKFDHSRAEVGLNYNYYVVNNLAIGVDASYMRNKQEDVSSDLKDRTWMFGPQLTLNIPSKSLLNNLYLQADAHTGKRKMVFNAGFNDVSNEYKTSDVSVGIGYTNFISRNIAFSPVVAYRWNSFEDDNNNFETNSHGLVVRTGLKLFF